MIKETFLFRRAVGLTVTNKGIGFFHDYGQDYIPWDEITHTFAAILKRRKLPYPILFIMKKRDSDTFYYIDGNTIAQKHFRLSWEVKGSRHPLSIKKSQEEEFQNLLKEICSRCSIAYLDRPLITYLRGGQFFLPSFSSLKNIYDYCIRIAGTVSKKEPEARSILKEEEELKKLTPPSKAREEWNTGKVIENRYTVQDILKGGMGTVYIVFDSDNVRFLAMKTFQERYLWDERVIKQFIKEAEIWIKLDHHPNIVKAELVKVIEGKPYIFLEYIQGTDLEKLMNQEQLSLKQILEFTIQFCEGMDYAFNKLGLVHRDIKPSNCLITREGILKITDFGLGKIFAKSPMDGELVSLPQKTKKGKTSTSSTTMVGTIPFMAPELFSNLRAAGIKTDIYSFGVLLYMMLTGTNPFFSEDVSDVISNHLTLTPESPTKLNPDIPESLCRVLFKCIKKKPELRYDEFSEILAELEIIYIETYGSPYERLESEDIFREEDWINKGLSLASIACHREAIITFDQALKLNPISTKALLYKGVSLLNFGKILESLSCFDECLKIDKYIWEPWFYKGEAYWKLGNNDKALSCFDRALEFADEDTPILGRKGKLLSETGKTKAALECYEMALKQNPRSAEIWYEKGSLYITMKRFEESLIPLENSLEINPRFKLAWYQQGIALYHLGYLSEAINSQQKAISLDPEFGEAWVCIGDCRRELGNKEEAMKAYQTAIEIQPENIEAYISSVKLLKESSRWDDALLLLDKTLEIAPENPGLLHERAEVLMNLGYYEEALSMCQFIQDIDPENEEVRLITTSVVKMIDEQDKIFRKISSVSTAQNEIPHTDLDSLLTIFCNVKDALEYMEKIGGASPRESFIKASLLFANGEYEKCQEHLNMALGDPQNLKTAMNLKSFVEGRIELQRRTISRKKGLIGTFLKKGEKEGRTSLELLILGLERMTANMFLDAIAYFNEAISLDPTMHSCRFFLGKAYAMEGIIEKSLHYFRDFQKHVSFSRGFWKEKLSILQLSDPREVEESYYNLIGNNPDDYHPWISYLTYLSERKYYGKARLIASGILRSLNKYIRLPENSIRLLNIKGILQILLGRYREAQRSFAKAREIEPRNPASLAGLGKCYEAKGLYDNAKKFFGILLENRELNETGGYMLADVYLKSGENEEALSLLENMIKRHKKSWNLMNKKAQILLYSQMNMEFSNYYSEIYSLDTNLIPPRVLRSINLLETQGIDDAIIELANILSLDQYNLIVSKNLCLLYIQSQNLQKAMTIFDSIISYYPLDYEGHMGKGMVCYLLKDFENAQECFRNALELNPLDPDLWQFMGAVNYHRGNFKDSGKCWERAIHYRSRFTQAWTNKGIFLYHQKDYRSALECAERVLRMDPENPPAWLCRGMCHWKLGNMDEAMRIVEKAISFSPQNITGWNLLGLIAFYGKNYELSKQSFEKATMIESKNAELWYNRGLLCLYMKTQEDGKRATEQLLAIDSEAKKCLDRALAIKQDFSVGFIAQFVFEKLREGTSPGHLLLSRAQNLDPKKFNEWAEEYQETRNPLSPLKPIELSDDPFYLPFERKLSIIEPLELMHLLRE